ncbi:MAG: leucine-rich repeat domain-containing protein, partial [Kiritimatiellae bacterium]|nr:leucine-rich repeat domain-containing protein [Kiritimatiellia bacterium]
DGVEWSYTVDGGNATVTGANPAEGNLVIPATLGDATVTAIAKEAFSGCSGLTGVELPAGLARIGKEAFAGCTNLSAVHISDLAAWCGIDFWNAYANPLFYAHRLYLDGAELTELAIPDGVASIGYCAFFGCSGLSSVTIPDSVTEIGASAFKNCPSLASVAIGAGVTNVEIYAFGDCPQLAAITVAPENAAYAGEGGVLFDKAGTRLVCCPAGKTGAYAVPAGVTDLVGGAFYGCAGLTSVTLPDGLLDIGYDAFWGCSGLTELAIPGSVTNIWNYAFDGCTGLATLVIPDSVTFIGSGVFYGCTGLAALEVPAAWYGTAKLADASVPKGCVVTYRGISPLAVATETLPKGRPGRAYETKLEATGGVEPYAWGPSVVYTESAAANSFAETGTAQGWQGDDACWDLALPFEFPFFGNSYTNAKINSNGAISFGTNEFKRYNYDESTFMASPIIAVMWRDMKTTSGNIYVDSGADAVTVRWQGTRYGDPMNFSATLCRDGRIVLSYGAGNADGGGIGISAGDGTNCVLSAKHQGGSMENAQDIVFTPPGLPSWLTVAADGTLGGIPAEAGTLAFA